jgi:hypothetical protein
VERDRETKGTGTPGPHASAGVAPTLAKTRKVSTRCRYSRIQWELIASQEAQNLHGGVANA